MLSFHSALRIFLAVEPVDMRKSFDGLHGVATERLGEDPRKGALFVFTNKRRNRLKILYLDRSGTCVLAKRLEQGTFHWPTSASAATAKLSLAPEALQLLIDGVDLRDGERRAWYEESRGFCL